MIINIFIEKEKEKPDKWENQLIRYNTGSYFQVF